MPKKKNIKISAYLITKNEEARLDMTLKAVKKIADEIIIVDSESTDKTPEIAKKHKAIFLSRKWKSYADQKHYAQNKCSNKWVLSIDADEVLSKELIEEIKNLKQSEPEFKAYNLKICDTFPNEKKPKLFAKNYKIIRLYHRDYATMKKELLTEDRISLTKDIPLGSLKGVIHHYSFLNISQQISKLNHYTDDVIKTSEKKEKKYSFFRLATELPRQFIIYYIVKRYFLSGFWGFVISINNAHMRFTKIAKCIEKNKINNIK